MGNTFGKAEISLIFKDTSKTSYKAGEPINLIVKFQFNRVYKDTQIKITFKGSTFTVNKILSIGKWNNKESIHQPHEISFEITSPIDFSPSKDGVYTVEAKLEGLGHLWKSTRAETSLNIPLVP